MGHWKTLLASSILLFIAAFKALPQEANYRHYTDSSGNIVFAQKLTWQKYENIDHYRIEIEEISKTSRRAKVLDKTTEENSIEVNLPAGTYRYRISIYNVLGNLETKSEWKEFEIFKATQPKIESISPENVEIEKDAEDKRKTLELTGENLLRQSKYRISDSGGTTDGKVETADGNSATVTFDFQGFPAGEYKLTVKNPGGLESEAAFTLTIKEPEPVVEEPEIEEPIEEEPEPIEEEPAAEEPIVEEPEPIEEEPIAEEPEIEEPAEPVEEEPVVEGPEPVEEEPEVPVEEEDEPFDFDLDMAIGAGLSMQIFGREYTGGQFYEEFFGSRLVFPRFDARISFLPIKTRIGNFGIGVSGDFVHVKNEVERRYKSYTLTGNIYSVLGEAVYQKSIGRFTLDIHAGAGLQNFQGFSFDFTTPDGSYSTEKIDSSSIVLGGGCGVQFTIWKGLYAEAEIGFKYTAELEMGTIEPKIMLGWKF